MASGNVISDTIEFILMNKEWIFSGVGISILSCLVWLFFRKKNEKSKIVQTQKSGKKSVNIQVQGNVTIGEKKDNRSC
jgi:plastocyanin domain-containing protein